MGGHPMKTIREIVGDRDAYSVSPTDTVTDVVLYLFEKEIGAIAVCDNRKVVGVFSERDLMRRVVHAKRDPDRTAVRDVMTSPVFHVSIDERYDVAKALMLGKNFRHLVILDEEENLCGFVSMRELLEVDLAETKDLVHKLNDGYYQHDFERPKR
jgi:CBS domain-containing protein